jgi:hypothetical protein
MAWRIDSIRREIRKGGGSVSRRIEAAEAKDVAVGWVCKDIVSPRIFAAQERREGAT